MALTRDSQRTETIYTTPGFERGKPESVFFTPDGDGRIWYDSVEEAKADSGLTKVVHLLSEPEDY